jgi:hypothetical protein
MELKIRIKEVTVEWRPITLEEKCMFLLSADMHYSQEIRDEIEKRMDMLGLIRRFGSENVLFRVETIRDATPEERMAWMYLNMVGEDRCPVCSDIGIGCESCILVQCIASPRSRQKAKSILSNKEVILELV